MRSSEGVSANHADDPRHMKVIFIQTRPKTPKTRHGASADHRFVLTPYSAAYRRIHDELLAGVGIFISHSLRSDRVPRL